MANITFNEITSFFNLGLGDAFIGSASLTRIEYEYGTSIFEILGTGLNANTGSGQITGFNLYAITNAEQKELFITGNLSASLKFSELKALLNDSFFSSVEYLFSQNNIINGSAADDFIFGAAGSDQIYGGDGDDELFGDGVSSDFFDPFGNDSLYGGNGNDILRGGLGNNYLEGGEGHDRLIGSGRDSLLAGGNGNDIYEIYRNETVLENLNEGNDIVLFNVVDNFTNEYRLQNDVENLAIFNHSTKVVTPFSGIGNKLANIISLGFDSGRKVLVMGLGGNDRISTGSNDDTINGGGGDDVMIGGTGNDTYYVHNLGDRVLESAGSSNGQNDTVIFAVKEAVTVSLGGQAAGFSNNVIYTNIETLKFSSALNTNYNAIGNGAANQINASAGNNAIFSLGGNDSLNGFGGNDSIDGGTGTDLITGGEGRDQLTGGANPDVFDFNKVSESGPDAATRDTITDFISGQDKIDLSGIDAIAATAGNDRFQNAFVSSFTSAGQLMFSEGILYANTDGDLEADLSIALTGASVLTIGDIIL